MLLALLWGAYATRQQTRAETTRDSALAVSVVLRSQNQALALSGDSLTKRSQTPSRTAYVTRWRAETVWASLTPTSSVSDSLEAARAVIGLLQQAVDSLTVAFEAQQAASAKFRLAYQGESERADSLASVLRRMPVGCKRLPLLGIPVPVVGIGYALTPKGIAPAVALTVPLGKC